ncbi:Pyruvate decarboxylase [Colletotrichum fructicola Nara gc5]|uniref:Pyruvate decarboxylase n=1 Tax=Colletotrichum fructicola (strain Nara gc5) TaxID=1213859 RepID=A0A7J6JLT9_COLFN|nr:Pyruvate decarboxylase [Colletotrichum fructicola Nara gc5]
MSTAATAASASHANAYEMLGTPRLRISTQIAQALLVTPPLNSTIDDLPHIVVGSREFVLETQLSRRRGRGRSSWIRDHGEFLVEVIQSRAGASFWSCRRCDAKGSPRLFGAAATSAPQEHLLRHKVCRISAVSDEDSDSSTLPSSADTSGPPSYKRLRPNSNVPRAKITTLRDLSVASIVSADLPFVHFENAYVQQMFRYHNPEVAGEIPWGRTAIRDRLDDFCRRGEALVKSELHSALSKIHLSFDLWSSPNIYAFMAVTGHFIHADGTIQSRLLAFPQHHGNHSGLSLSETLIDAVDRYELRPRIGVTISDNATNNDTCLRAFYRSISPEMTDADVKARRMRCYGHILNLAARAFLFGADKEVLEAESDFFRLCERYEDDLELWRKLGPVGRLRNIVKFVRASPQRTERYRKAAAEVDGDSDFRIFSESRREAQLILNNDTRWNSTYLMIERAVKKKTEIQAFLLANNDDDDARQHISEKDLLSSEDWKVLAEIGMILEPFYLQTKRCEGWGINDGHGRLWEVTLGIEYLLSHLINWKIYYNASLSPSIDHDDEGDSQQSQQSQKRARRARRRHHNLQALPDHVHQDWASPASRSASRFESLNEEWQTFLRSSVEQAWQKLFDYYDLLGDSPLFSGAIILHPSYGISYLRDIWGQEHQEGWVEKALKTLTEYFDQWYRQPGEIYPSSWQAGMLPVDPGAGDGEDVHYRQWVNSWRRKTPPRTDELDLYLRHPPETTSDPVRWWRDHSETFPALSRLALDVFAVPAMAADFYIQIPVDLVAVNISSARLQTPLSSSAADVNSSPERKAVLTKILERIYSAKRPVIIADGECRPFGIVSDVQALIDTTGWPTWTTNFGKGLFDETRSNFHGIYRGEFSDQSVKETIDRADLVLFFGPHLSSSNTYGFTAFPTSKVAIFIKATQVELGTDIFRDVPASYVASGLLHHIDVNKIAKYEPYPLLPRDSLLPLSALADDSSSIFQDKLWRSIANILRPGDIVLGETGTAGYGVRDMPLPPHTRLFTPVTWLSIGFMLPAAQGAALAQREMIAESNYYGLKQGQARTILLIGDGSFQMTAQELATIIRHNLDVVIFLINNDGYTIERCIHGRKQEYNDISTWRYLLAPHLFGASKDTYTAACRNWSELHDVLINAQLGSGSGLRMVEVFMDREDAPTGPLLQYLETQKVKATLA